MLDAIINLVHLTVATLCIWFLARGTYRAAKFLLAGQWISRVAIRLAHKESRDPVAYWE